MSKRDLMRLVKEFQVWEVERIRPGQMLVGCPVCKLEKSKGIRVHDSMVNSNQFKNHFEQEHKQQKFLLKVRCLKCPICQELVPAGLLGVHFSQGRSCEKAVVLASSREIGVKEERIENENMEILQDLGAREREYVELFNPDHVIKLESGKIIKTEAVEEFYHEETPEEEAPKTNKEEILKIREAPI